MHFRLKIVLCLLTMVAYCPGFAVAQSPLKLVYDKPSSQWTEALPLGNGRIGAMVFGGTEDERLQMNESTLWGGAPHDYAAPESHSHLDEIRSLIFAGKVADAEKLAASMMGDPRLLMPYQPFCDLRLHFAGHAEATEYRRDLDLNDATAETTYRVGSVTFRREAFISFPDQVLVVRITASQPGKLAFTMGMDSPQTGTHVETTAENTLQLTGQMQPRPPSPRSWTGGWDQPGMRFAAVLKVLPEGGSVRADNDRLELSGANAVTILFSNATSFRNYQDTGGDALQTAQGYLHRAEKRSYPELRQRHLKDFRDLFSRVHLNLGEDHATDTTDRRIKNFAQNEDPSLLALYFEFGRYLLISSSRPGGLPANLQGIWNQDLSAAWSSKFTTNINLEMNYWQADTGDLWETQEPLWNLIRTLCVSGARTAQTKYHSSGWVLHHNTDIWAAIAPVNDDLVKVVLPYIDSRYRTFPDREHRAIAGPSMGGLQTLNIALDHSADFAYVGVFSSGWFPDSMKEEQDTDVAEYRASGKPFRLFWLDVGKYDIALQNSRATVTVLKDAGIHVEDHESGGFHAWPNWRDYLDQYASLIFKSAPRASEAVGQVDMRHDQL